MFALHGEVLRLLEENHPLERDARHYPDLFVLAGRDEFRSMLASRSTARSASQLVGQQARLRWSFVARGA